jgi:hypothetical protein
MQYETCRHVKIDGAYCGSPALKNRKYCHYHLEHRIRRLRRVRARHDNVPYCLEIPLLDSPSAIRFAISEIVQALGTGQLDHHTAGKMLYGIQMANSLNRRAEKAAAEAAAAAADQPEQTQPDPALRVQEYPQLEIELGLDPGVDIDAEIDWTVRQADEQAELRHANDFPPVPPGMRIGSPQFRVYREEAYQALNMRLNHMKHDLKDYYAERRKRGEEQLKKEMASAIPAPESNEKTA